MAKVRRYDEVELFGIAHRNRPALLVSTALQTATALVLTLPAYAQPAPNARPTGGVVVGGAASISQTSNNTAINQSSQRAAVNWQGFNVGSQQSVNFNQPSAQSVTLNRVVGPDPSQIAGRINANGQVVLINQSGVTFYQGAQVNTNGLMVSAIGMTNQSVQNFVNGGKLVLDQPGNPNAAVVNEGTITVKQAGLAALVAPQVANKGIITATLGHVVLAGAKTATLDLYGDGLLSLDVNNQVMQAPVGKDGKTVTALVTNTGTIIADGGTVQLTARAADGIVQNLVQAGGKIRAATIGEQTGMIALNGVGGSIIVEGQLSAAGAAPGTKGGAIEVVTDGNVTVASAAKINASGKASGGTLAIGTTLARAKGGPSVTPMLTAKDVLVQQGAVIAANATATGNGGRVTVLSTGTTTMNGTIAAMGGPQGGDGGFVETSGVQILDVGPTASVSAAAPHGTGGQWLLDPDSDILITNPGSGPENAVCTAGVCSPTTDSSLLFASTINTALNGGTSVTVTTNNKAGTQAGNITVGVTAGGTDGEIQLTGTQFVSLTLDAGAGGGAGSITINSPITDVASGGVLSLSLSAPNGGAGITLNNDVRIGGNITMIASGNVTEAASASLATPDLTGTAASFSLPSHSNAIGEIDTLTATSGDITVVNNAATFGLNGTHSARNIFYEDVATGGTIALGFGEGSVALNAAPGGRISLVADNLTEDFATNSVSALNGIIEIAPFTQGTSITLGGTGGLSLPQSILSLMNTGTLRIGEATIDGSATITAGSIVVPGTASIDLAAIATTLFELHAAAVNGATGGITVGGTVTVPDNAFLQSGGPGGITVAGSVDAAGFGTVGLQTDALNITTGGTITAGVFELAPNTPGTGITLGAAGVGLSLPSLTGIGAFDIRIGAVTEPGNTSPTTTAGSINIAGNFGAGNVAAELDATGNVTEATSASLTTNVLTGTAASFSLPSPTNAIAGVDTLTATSGNIGIVDDTNLVLTGIQSAQNLFYEVVLSGGTIQLGNLGEGPVPVTLTAASGGHTSLVADNITTIPGDTLSSINAPSGRVELAPFSPINTSLLGSSGLVIGPQLLSYITPTGTLAIGGFTNVPAGAAAPAASASSVSVDAPLNLTGTATTLDLLATGTLTQPDGPVTVNTLIGDAGSATLLDTGNDINTLGAFAARTGGFTLADNGNTGTLLVTGPVTAATNVALSTGATGGVSASGAIDAGTTLAIVTGSGGIALLNGGGLTGTTVDLSSTGGVSEVAGAMITAGILQSSGGISGGAAILAGASNAIAALGNFAVSGNTFSLSDTGSLSVDGAVSASSVTIGGAAGSTPSGITLLSAGSVVAPTITLSAGGNGIALDSGTVLGETGASIDMASAGGISEDAGATIIAATLASLGNITGGAVTLAGTGNAIGDLGNFTVAGKGFSLSDQGSLDITGLLSASSVTIGGAAGSTPSGISLSGTGSIAAPSVTLSAGNGGISIGDSASLGEADANVGLATTGTVTEASGGAVIAATLAVTGSTVSLPSNSNAVSVLGNSTATSFSLYDGTDLLIAATLNAAQIALLAPNNQISLGNGATILTSGNSRPPGPLQPSLEPSNGAAGAYIQAANFVQIGTSFVAGQSGGPNTLQISTTGNMQFDPPLGLSGSGTWLILNLTNGSAAGDVFVNALDVTYTVPGSTNLFGTIAGISGGPAAAVGFIQPAINANYLFNGCVIAAATCTLPLTELTNPLPELTNSDITSALGGLYEFKFLSGGGPSLVGLPRMVIVAVPLFPAAAPRLTDPDVVPPNIGYLDY